MFQRLQVKHNASFFWEKKNFTEGIVKNSNQQNSIQMKNQKSLL